MPKQAKIRYQTMFDRTIFDYLEKKQMEYKHKTLSETVNWLIRQIKMLDDFKDKDKQETKAGPTNSRFVGDHIMNKLGIDTSYGSD